VVRPGIDDRDLALAYDVADRAGKGERARIVAENPPHAGAGFIDDAGLERKIAVERDVVVIGHLGVLALTSFRDGRKGQTRNLEGGGNERGPRFRVRRFASPRNDDCAAYENA